MVIHSRLPTLTQFEDSGNVMTDTLRPTRAERRRSSVASLPPLEGAWLQELQEITFPQMQRQVSFVSSIRTAAIPPSIAEDEHRAFCCVWCCV